MSLANEAEKHQSKNIEQPSACFDIPLESRLLQKSPLSPLDAARLILELLEATQEHPLDNRHACLQHCRHIIQSGAKQFVKEKQTLPFKDVVEELMLFKAHRRQRTLSEIRQYCSRIMRHNPCWDNRPLRHISATDCHEAIQQSFSSLSMQRKAHIILHGLFNFGMKRGWCSSNPIQSLVAPRPIEQRIDSLSLTEIRRLLNTALRPEHLLCAPAVGIMLWAGIRPNEVTRLCWQDINLADRSINIRAQHSKTGGSRHVSIQPVLLSWLRRVSYFMLPGSSIVPRAWDKRWRHLRRSAGFKTWKPDSLRHSFASYHLKHFRDLRSLQMEMGHSNAELLRTRYLSMDGITSRAAAQFWGQKIMKPSPATGQTSTTAGQTSPAAISNW